MMTETKKPNTTSEKLTKKQKTRIQRWKKFFHVINFVLSIALIFLGACLIILREETEESADSLYLFVGILQVVWCTIIFIVGALLPKDPKKLSPRAQKWIKILAVLAMLDGKGSYALYNNIEVLQRYWEPAWVVPVIFFEGAFVAFSPDLGIVGNIILLSAILYAVLLATTLAWSILYRKETGTFRWTVVLMPTLVLVVIFGGIAGYTYLKGQLEGETLQERVAAATAESEKALAAYEPGGYNEEDIEASQMTMDEIFGMLQNDIGGDVCFFWVPGDDEEDISLLAWNDSSEDIYVYQWNKQGDKYALINAFISPSMSKEDVEGKEQGVIPAPSN